MFKKLETAWNARTPVYLHNGTKENFIFQFGLLGAFLACLFVWDRWNERKAFRDYRKNHPEK